MRRHGFSSSSSSSSWTNNFPVQKCRCSEEELPFKTSWTKNNPGRRYWACPNYGTREFCGFYKWLDSEMCARSKQIIPGLLSKLNNLEDELNDFMIRERKLEAELREANSKRITMEKQLDVLKNEKKNFIVKLGVFFLVVVVVFYVLNSQN
ncbi:GRF zinc finger containing protein [Striga asiatica]|uniref:GRF zinc finger containing protein n=1 Tax=Striga asiatica TaxID=4170 RepID=A0A5A7PJ86_STRAF|nr:GRF zinc finger containing protein [Striga asiatica]